MTQDPTKSPTIKIVPMPYTVTNKLVMDVQNNFRVTQLLVLRFCIELFRRELLRLDILQVANRNHQNLVVKS